MASASPGVAGLQLVARAITLVGRGLSTYCDHRVQAALQRSTAQNSRRTRARPPKWSVFMAASFVRMPSKHPALCSSRRPAQRRSGCPCRCPGGRFRRRFADRHRADVGARVLALVRRVPWRLRCFLCRRLRRRRGDVSVVPMLAESELLPDPPAPAPARSLSRAAPPPGDSRRPIRKASKVPPVGTCGASCDRWLAVGDRASVCHAAFRPLRTYCEIAGRP